MAVKFLLVPKAKQETKQKVGMESKDRSQED